jgi:ABC-type branched-subunit amino acid transport system substrate-binding protein
VQSAATGAALVTTPVTGNSPGEYRGMIRWAKDLDARNFWISIPRPYAVNIVTQAYELGFGPDFAYHFLDFSEWQASQLPEGASVWTSLPFVASDHDPAVQDFVARLRRSSGANLVTHVAFTHYNAVMALKAAMEKADATTGADVIAALDGLELATATGAVTLGSGRYATMPMFVARGTRQGLEMVEKVDAAESGTTCI